jgi:hypothetical protein
MPRNNRKIRTEFTASAALGRLLFYELEDVGHARLNWSSALAESLRGRIVGETNEKPGRGRGIIEK